MRFHGMQSLTAAFPHTELRSGTALFDVHNAAVLLRIGLDFQVRCIDVEWRVENLLEDERFGPYRTARVVLTIRGISDFSISGELLTDPGEAIGVDFIEYLPQGEGPEAVRFVFTSSGEMLVSGTDCELRYSVLTELS